MMLNTLIRLRKSYLNAVSYLRFLWKRAAAKRRSKKQDSNIYPLW